MTSTFRSFFCSEALLNCTFHAHIFILCRLESFWTMFCYSQILEWIALPKIESVWTNMLFGWTIVVFEPIHHLGDIVSALWQAYLYSEMELESSVCFLFRGHFCGSGQVHWTVLVATYLDFSFKNLSWSESSPFRLLSLCRFCCAQKSKTFRIGLYSQAYSTSFGACFK